MKVIIAGSRNGVPYETLLDAIEKSGFEITEVISGGAPGVDTQAEVWAGGKRLPVTRFPANWVKFGKSAGPRRNAQMAEYGEALIALWNGNTKGSGTYNMIETAKKKGLKVYVHSVK